MAKKNDVTVEEKLRSLYDLQLVDSRIDEIRNVRGELPLEVEDLEDEVAGLNRRLEKLDADIEVIDNDIKNKKNQIEESKTTIKKYSEQQKNVRNFVEMSSKTADPAFLLRKKIEKKFAQKYPELWVPLYSRVTFSDKAYSDALDIGDYQREIMDEVMKIPGIEETWDTEEVELKIKDLLNK